MRPKCGRSMNNIEYLAADHGREMCICCGQLGVESAPEMGIGVVLWFQRK